MRFWSFFFFLLIEQKKFLMVKRVNPLWSKIRCNSFSIAGFIKPYRKPVNKMHWSSVRFYEMGVTLSMYIHLFNSCLLTVFRVLFSTATWKHSAEIQSFARGSNSLNPTLLIIESSYVDKHRNAAVVMGERDVKIDVRIKRRKERSENI